MTATTDAILRRIRGLLAKAEGTDNPHERDAFQAKAFAMMEEHRIALADVTDGRPTIAHTVYPLAATAKYLRPSLYLMGAVAGHYDVVVVTGPTGNSRTPILVGDQDDIVATVLMFESLLRQRDRAILVADRPAWMNVNKFRADMATGYAIEIDTRLGEIRKARDTTTPGTGLVLANRRSLVDEALEGLVEPLNHNRRTGFAVAVNEGEDAARRADLGQDRFDQPTGPRALTQ